MVNLLGGRWAAVARVFLAGRKSGYYNAPGPKEEAMEYFPYVVGGILCIVGLGLGSGGIGAIRKAKAAAAWPTVPGKLLSSEVVAHTGIHSGRRGSKGQASYQPVVRYSYSVGGKELSGATIGLVDVRGSKAAVERKIAAFASGKELAVHYDPADPKRALLDVTAAGSGWLIGLASLIVLVGALVLVNAATIAGLFAAFGEP
jgi:hypothetical protein